MSDLQNGQGVQGVYDRFIAGEITLHLGHIHVEKMKISWHSLIWGAYFSYVPVAIAVDYFSDSSVMVRYGILIILPMSIYGIYGTRKMARKKGQWIRPAKCSRATAPRPRVGHRTPA